jgi:nucleotide-binding universal stress UspA family protein
MGSPARAYLERLVSLAGQRKVDVQSEIIQGRAAEQICGWALQHGADLTVLASHGEHGRSEWTLSSTDIIKSLGSADSEARGMIKR